MTLWDRSLHCDSSTVRHVSPTLTRVTVCLRGEGRRVKPTDVEDVLTVHEGVGPSRESRPTAATTGTSYTSSVRGVSPKGVGTTPVAAVGTVGREMSRRRSQTTLLFPVQRTGTRPRVSIKPEFPSQNPTTGTWGDSPCLFFVYLHCPEVDYRGSRCPSGGGGKAVPFGHDHPTRSDPILVITTKGVRQ